MRWKIVKQPMLEGSLGVKGLFLFNEALLESGCGDL